MLKEVNMKDALIAFADGGKVLCIMPVEGTTNMAVNNLDFYLGKLTKKDMRFLIDDVPVKVDTTQPMETKPKRKYTRHPKPEAKKELTSSIVFDDGKLLALVKAGKDMKFLMTEFGASEQEIKQELKKLGFGGEKK